MEFMLTNNQFYVDGFLCFKHSIRWNEWTKIMYELKFFSRSSSTEISIEGFNTTNRLYCRCVYTGVSENRAHTINCGSPSYSNASFSPHCSNKYFWILIIWILIPLFCANSYNNSSYPNTSTCKKILYPSCALMKKGERYLFCECKFLEYQIFERWQMKNIYERHRLKTVCNKYSMKCTIRGDRA